MRLVKQLLMVVQLAILELLRIAEAQNPIADSEHIGKKIQTGTRLLVVWQRPVLRLMHIPNIKQGVY